MHRSISDMELSSSVADMSMSVAQFSSPGSDLNTILELSLHIAGCSVAAIVFSIDDVNFLSKPGTTISEFSVSDLLATVPSHREFIIEDLLEKDPGNPLLKNGIRFLTAIPIFLKNSITPGYLCVVHHQPHLMSAPTLSALRLVAKQVSLIADYKSEVLSLQKSKDDVRNAEDQISTIFHNSIVGVIVVNEEGGILNWNPKAEAIFGWAAAEVKGKVFSQAVIPTRYHEEFRKHIGYFGNSDSDPLFNHTIEIKAFRKNGTEFDVAVGISLASANNRSFFIIFVSDITDRITATKKLDEQKAFYETILNELPADIAVFDADHKYLFVNPRGIKDPVLRQYIIGKDDFQYAEYRNRDISVAQIRRDQFMQVKQTNHEIRWEDTVKAPDGTPITHLRRLFPVSDSSGALQLVIGFGVDITDRKIMEEKQAALVSQLSSQNTQLVDFCNIVSHNLRAPLVNMSMLVNFIEECDDREEQDMLVSKLKPVIENLHGTFNELVESIQIKQDYEIVSEKIDLAECIEKTVEGMKMEIRKYDATIHLDIEEAPHINFPSKYLFSIFHNLISNSLKYQSPHRKPEIHIQTKRNDDSIILSVRDNGLGIDMTKHKDNLFKIGKVFHYHPNAKGFGLFMTKTQVEAMGGDIWVESAPDEGATFHIEFKKQYRE